MSNMIKCKTCNALIAAEAKVCPSCGAKNSIPLYKKWWFWIIIILIFPYVVNRIIPSNSSDNSAIQKTDLEQTIEKAKKIDYRIIYDDYQKNPINADSIYKDKYWELSGVINDIDREIMGNPYITFEIKYLQNIRITFNKTEENKIGQLQKGQKVTIIGKCKGTLLSSTVAFDNCYLIQ